MDILVMGPHGSGNRLNGRMLEAYRAVNITPVSNWRIGVVSFPGQIPPVMQPDAVVVSMRERRFVAASMLKEGMVRDLDLGLEWYDLAHEQISGWLDTVFLPHVEVEYETTVGSNFGVEMAIEDMAKMLGVPPWPFDEEIFDGNEKYRVHAIDCDMGEGCSCM